MINFLLKRLLMLPLVVIGITFLLFSLTNLLPPEMRASLYVQGQKEMNPETIKGIIREHRLDAPLLIQYWQWAKSAAKGDLGYSRSANMKVTEAIKTYLPATLELTLFSIIPIFFLGLWLGMLSAAKKNSVFDNLTRIGAISTYSLPTFVFGLLLLMIFYGGFKIFPPGRYSLYTDMAINSGNFSSFTGLLTIDALLNGNLRIFADAVAHIILPATVLCLGSVALLIRMTRTSVLEELNKDYVRTARAKGLKERTILSRHVRRNALIPVITLVSLQFIRLLGGVVITETVFDYPGIGSWGVKAAQQLDLAGVMGFALMTAVLFIIGNTAADILYAVIDPRIRYD